jgi:hypothetical protein
MSKETTVRVSHIDNYMEDERCQRGGNWELEYNDINQRYSGKVWVKPVSTSTEKFLKV